MLTVLLEEQEPLIRNRDWEQITKTEWLERLQGRTGCWAAE